MQAVQLDSPNGMLTVREVPVPHPRKNEVLVRMAAAPFNPSDLGSLSGQSYRGAHRFPFTPGLEGSGRVVQAGQGLMPRYLKGRRVACAALLDGDGTWAEYMVTSAAQCVPFNANVGLEQGAMLLVNPLSALAFFEIAKNGKHRAIVSTAAASALGWMILRLGKRYGVPIIHIVRRQEQVELVQARGGEFVLNSSDPDFVARLGELTKKQSATLLLDAISGDITQKLIDAALYDSTILLYSRLATNNAEIDARTVLVKNLHLDGWFLANWLAGKNLIARLLFSRKAQSLIGTDLASPVHERLPLSGAQQGLQEYVCNMTAGMVLLVANPQEVMIDG